MLKIPKGTVRLWHRGQLIWERKNLFVDTGLPALANLIAGATAGQYVTVIGFGSGTAAPLAADTGLNAPYYFKAIDSYSFPSPGSTQFAYSLTTSDSGAPNPFNITELGLFANSGNVAMPGVTQPVPLIAHVSVPLFTYTGGGNYSGTWTLTF